MKASLQGLFHIWVATLLISIPLVAGQNCSSYSTINSTVSLTDEDLFSQHFPTVSFVRQTGNVFGHQNITWCCIAAVIQYLRNDCRNNSLIQVDERIFGRGQQFPCGAAFMGDFDGAPMVQVTYAWTETYCRGWQLSAASNMTQWLQTLVGFLLPSVVFALNVPRGHKFLLSERLFARGPIWQEMTYAFVAILSAALDTAVWLCVVFSMAGPLILSGLFEAFLDHNVIKYLADKETDHTFSEGTTKDTMPLAFRARILFTVLGGNLELATAWKHVMVLAQDLDELDNPEFESRRRPSAEVSRSSEQPPWNRRMRLASFDVSDTTATGMKALRPRGLSAHHLMPISTRPMLRSGAAVEASNIGEPDHHDGTIWKDGVKVRFREIFANEHETTSEISDQSSEISQVISSKTDEKGEWYWTEYAQRIEQEKRERKRRKTVGRIDTRMKAMLACQYSFGSTIGAPVVFYVGSFVYALFEILQTYGNNDVSHALAFGSWWMIIPHIATVSGLLLGGNNPNTLGVIIGAIEGSKLQYAFGSEKPPSEDAIRSEEFYQTKMIRDTLPHCGVLHPITKRILEPVYSSSLYTPVSMWDRGQNKHKWLLVLCADTWNSYQWNPANEEEVRSEVLHFVRDAIMLSSAQRMVVFCGTFLLLFIPCLLGWTTSYFTPQVGVSCRSLTFTIYMCAQLLLLVDSSKQMFWDNEYWRLGSVIKRHDHSRVSTDTTKTVSTYFSKLRELSHQDIIVKGRRGKTRSFATILYQSVMFFLPGLAIFSAIGGTLMQIIGVYRNCLCKLNASDWPSSKRSTATLGLSSNQRREIIGAQHHWVVFGSVSIAFLSFICYAGWWYQKRARVEFNELAVSLGEDIKMRFDTVHGRRKSDLTVARGVRT